MEHSAVSPNSGISLSPCLLGLSISPPQREGCLNSHHVHQGRHKVKQGASCSLKTGDATGQHRKGLVNAKVGNASQPSGQTEPALQNQKIQLSSMIQCPTGIRNSVCLLSDTP